MGFIDWLTSTIGTGTLLAIVVFLSRNLIIERLKKSIAHEYKILEEDHKAELKKQTDKAILELKSKADIEYEKFRVRVGPYSEMQFKQYNKLWASLCDLKSVMDELWVEADRQILIEFAKILRETVKNIQKNALLIEKIHYDKLINSMNIFLNYEFGKRKLINLRTHGPGANTQILVSDVENLIDQNEANRAQLNTDLEYLMDQMRDQISGTNIHNH